jgi:hypothetical protein
MVDLTVGELEVLWRMHLGGSMPDHLPKFLLPKLLVYRIQVQQSGGLTKSAIRYLDQIVNDLEAGREPPMPYPSNQKIKPGSVIIREHDGVQQRVMVLDVGFAWNGKTYGSLSSVAKAITGTNWNGQRFFGLKDRRRPPVPATV